MNKKPAQKRCRDVGSASCVGEGCYPCPGIIKLVALKLALHRKPEVRDFVNIKRTRRDDVGRGR